MERENFRERVVLAICWAGSDRSRYIAEELNKRGYIASHVGVINNFNYVTEEDLAGVGAVIFSSSADKEIFKQDKRLNKILKASGATVHILGISEDEKDKAHGLGKIDELRKTISQKLDNLGFRDRNLDPKKVR